MPRTNRTFEEIDRERYPFRGYAFHRPSVHSGSGCRFAQTITKLSEEEYKDLRKKESDISDGIGADLSFLA